MRALHVIHDFLPRHRAGSEIYCLELCRALQDRGTQVHVLCADYDPGLPHGQLRWRAVEGIGVTELINNWAFGSFAESYASPLLERRLAQALDALQPDLVHIHNLLNLSLTLPALARRRGLPVVATLHDYTLVCPSGGQRVHVAEQHVCHDLDLERCARCFPQHPLHTQLRYGRLLAAGGGTPGRLARAVRSRFPTLLARLAGVLGRRGRRPATGAPQPITAQQIADRLAAAQAAMAEVDLFVAPSPALAAEYRRLGVPAERLRVSDYGFPPLAAAAPAARGPRDGRPLRLGFVGTLTWHKGAHLLLAAVAQLPAGSYQLTLFGDPEVFPGYTRKLREAAAGLPVRFAGPFARHQVGEVFAQLDVLVVPSLWPENSPLVIHEAFQAGVPVVGSRLGGTADLVHDGVSGLLYEAYSAGALAAALQRLLAEPELLPRLSAGAPAVKPIAQDAEEWQALYARLLAAEGLG